MAKARESGELPQSELPAEPPERLTGKCAKGTMRRDEESKA
jgi:hypothetical protein